MSVKIKVHPVMRKYIDNLDELDVMGRTVEECINRIDSEYPGFKLQLVQQRKIRDQFEIFINGESAYPEELNKQVEDGDVLTIISYISGG